MKRITHGNLLLQKHHTMKYQSLMVWLRIRNQKRRLLIMCPEGHSNALKVKALHNHLTLFILKADSKKSDSFLVILFLKAQQMSCKLL